MDTVEKNELNLEYRLINKSIESYILLDGARATRHTGKFLARL